MSNTPNWIPHLAGGALAGGMAWGIRGQYGHETGAMIAGVLVGLLLVLLQGNRLPSLQAARAVALLTLGLSLGGSMTYGQTIGLTHDGPLIGQGDALTWGMLGLFVKGAIWIGLGSVLFGAALSGRRYHPAEWGLLIVVSIPLLMLGVWLLNEPFQPASRQLPAIYFSDSWRWEPSAELLPRRERWGGLLLVLVGWLAYFGLVRRDRLALRLGLFGTLAGGIGFVLGQSLQAAHAWHPEWFQQSPLGVGWWGRVVLPNINWWNMMETLFGATWGSVLGWAVWRNRALVANKQDGPDPMVGRGWEIALLAVHLPLLVAWNFVDYPPLARIADLALTMIVLPVIGVVTGRWWPYGVVLPITLLPICGKTVRQLVYRERLIDPQLGWAVYFWLPMIAAATVALYLAGQAKHWSGRQFAAVALPLATWVYFGLNFAFFRFPWPWRDWTARTPNAILFAICAVGLTTLAVVYGRQKGEQGSHDFVG